MNFTHAVIALPIGIQIVHHGIKFLIGKLHPDQFLRTPNIIFADPVLVATLIEDEPKD